MTKETTATVILVNGRYFIDVDSVLEVMTRTEKEIENAIKNLKECER